MRGFFLFLLAILAAHPSFALTFNSFVNESRTRGSITLFAGRKSATLLVDSNDWPGVIRAAKDLQTDIARVSGIHPALTHQLTAPDRALVIIGTIDRSAFVNQLVRDKKIDVSDIRGKWEACAVQVVNNPAPGIDAALVIAGSDKRGTIYGIYELSEQIGVSPWHWWADVPPKRHKQLFVHSGRHLLGPPAVKYRGIFINDEGPCLMTWARRKYGELNHQMYTNVFELILRLKGNYLWPAMWDNSFATDDPLNAKLADEYGVVISTSHHEPMMRAWKEWERAGNRKGSWDYSKNEAKLREFWHEGLRRTGDYEKVLRSECAAMGTNP